eukprot:RCo015563
MVLSTTSSVPLFTALSRVAVNAELLVISPRGSIMRPSGPYSISLQPFNPGQVFVGSSVWDQAFATFWFLVNTLRIQVVSVLVEDSIVKSFVQAALSMGAKEYGCSIVSSVVYITSADVSSSASHVVGVARAVILFGYTNVGLSIKAIRAVSQSIPIIVLSSLVDGTVLESTLVQSLGGNLDGVYMTQTVPSPNTNDPTMVRVVQSCITAVQAMNSSLSVVTGTVEGFLAAQVIMGAFRASFGPIMTSGMFRKAFYVASVFGVEGLILGPFQDSSCGSNSDYAACECNQGLRGVWFTKLVATTSGAGTPSVLALNVTFPIEGCGVQPTESSMKPASSSSLVMNVVIGVATPAAAMVILSSVYVVCARRRRRIKALSDAPSGEVTVVFTDVQDSTKLWDTCDGMKDALVTHNAVMREAIQRFKGYEVKTQGDSFMVAFRSAVDAADWCMSVQETLLTAPWPQDILEQPSCCVVHMPDSSTTSIPYLFRGLRVRMGMHVGFPQPEYNPRTNGVDYFGPMVNIAARIEALGAGGQVLMSRDAWNLLAEDYGVSVELGQFPLKGIRNEVAVVQVLPMSLSARKFPAIDRTKLLEQAVKDAATCDTCGQPLQCASCKHRSISISPLGQRKQSQGRKSRPFTVDRSISDSRVNTCESLEIEVLPSPSQQTLHTFGDRRRAKN